MEPSVILKPGKEVIFQRKHHWIFSGAIDQMPKEIENGNLLPVLSYNRHLLGYAYFNRRSALCGRIVSFNKTPPYEAMKQSLQQAIALRKRFIEKKTTTAYRLVNGEGDYLPGLVIDAYDKCLVIQIGTLGMEKIKPWLIDTLCSLLPIEGIYEKSLLPTRKEEGLEPFEGLLWGKCNDETRILENGMSFDVSIQRGQKTGFFLDHREMRAQIRSLAAGKSVLNCFSYTGGFTVAALFGGAIRADSVDSSQDAIDRVKNNIVLNGFSNRDCHYYCQDLFHFLKTDLFAYDIIILDPPAFAKKKKDLEAAAKAYRRLNCEMMKKMAPKTVLLSCSCSYHLEAPYFQQIILEAALEAKRDVRIIGRHRLAPDHPINLFHPETDYLKSLLLFLE